MVQHFQTEAPSLAAKLDIFTRHLGGQLSAALGPSELEAEKTEAQGCLCDSLMGFSSEDKYYLETEIMVVVKSPFT